MPIIESKYIIDLNEYKFRIPLYQRPYAWGKDEIEQLIADLKINNNDKTYYLGNIVVSKSGDFLDVIDGQQRLTTLYLILNKIEQSSFKLNYEIREEDNKFLQNIDWNNPTLTFKEAIETIKNLKIDKKWFNKVVVTLTTLPQEIDVVKYFEVMNNRGKQLEKHQILKAKFLEALKDDNNYDYAKIWDYCSDISSLVEDLIYYNDYKKEDRQKGAVEKLRERLLNFKLDEIKSKNVKVFSKNEEDKSPVTIDSIIKKEEKINNEERDFYKIKEYKSIVKFPIFLIHVLKVFIVINKNNSDRFKNLDEIIVNDRNLLDYFHEDKTHKKFLFDKALAKHFILLMFKLRILFDYFIFKRDENDNPVLIGKENKTLMMIELLFNFTAPQYFAQDWLSVALCWLYLKYENCDKDFQTIHKKFIDFLECFDKELAKVRLDDGSIIKFINNLLLQNCNFEKCKEENNDDDNEKEVKGKLEQKLNQGTSTQHYWFYKLDYLLWKKYNWNQNSCRKFDNLDYTKIKEIFRLTRLNSIEHIHSQSKVGENGFIKDNCNNNECCIDCFGNLALVSNHLNSALLNESFENKRIIIQKQINNGTIESLKVLLVYSKYKEWDGKNCKDHYKEMIDILCKNLSSPSC